MQNENLSTFSPELQAKIDLLSNRSPSITLGSLKFSSPLILAPMASLTHFPFRQLMQDLGSGGSISELISCHGINHGNDKTLKMLTIGNKEKNVGIQLFGEDSIPMQKASLIAQEKGASFIDINMGCPVRKVVTKGGGSALLQNTEKLAHFFSEIKKDLHIPLTIKIRTGWDESTLNAEEVIQIAADQGIEFVSVHGRTRAQQYKGSVNWDYLEKLAIKAQIPIIGNGDIHSALIAKKRLKETKCSGLMLARGPLRNPFIFLESFIKDGENIVFSPCDYWEISKKYLQYLKLFFERERSLLIQFRKMMVWFTTGYCGASFYRSQIFQAKTLLEVYNLTEEFYLKLSDPQKKIDPQSVFLSSGHG